MKPLSWLKEWLDRPSIPEVLEDFWDQLDNNTEQKLQNQVKSHFDEHQMKEAEELADKLFGGKIR